MKFFILGSHPELSAAEIAAVLARKLPPRQSSEVLLLDDVGLAPERLQERLAGTVKVGDIVGELAQWSFDEAVEFLLNLITSQSLQDGARGDEAINFGLSVYDAGNPTLANTLRANAKRLGLAVKRRLVADGRRVRLVTSRQSALSAVVVTTNKLLASGGEWVFIATVRGVVFGQTRAVQNFAAWSRRDYGRPARDPKAGMLPPKLARIMINLSHSDPAQSTLLDPFCGSGTVLMEAALLGFRQLICSDISTAAIKATRKNLSWLAALEQFNLPPTEYYITPAERLIEDIQNPVDCVVTELYLGAPLTGRETPAVLKKNIEGLLRIYRPSLLAIHSRLKPGGILVAAFPFFCTPKQPIRLPISALAADTGFSVQQTFDYARPNQRLGREITVLVPAIRGRASDVPIRGAVADGQGAVAAKEKPVRDGDGLDGLGRSIEHAPDAHGQIIVVGRIANMKMTAGIGNYGVEKGLTGGELYADSEIATKILEMAIDYSIDPLE